MFCAVFPMRFFPVRATLFTSNWCNNNCWIERRIDELPSPGAAATAGAPLLQWGRVHAADVARILMVRFPNRFSPLGPSFLPPPPYSVLVLPAPLAFYFVFFRPEEGALEPKKSGEFARGRQKPRGAAAAAR